MKPRRIYPAKRVPSSLEAAESMSPSHIRMCLSFVVVVVVVVVGGGGGGGGGVCVFVCLFICLFVCL